MPMTESNLPAVMLDLETLGTEPGCVITSVGAVAWWPRDGRIVSEFKGNISIEDSLHWGLKIEGKTLAWWFTQPTEAQRAMTDGARAMMPVLGEFAGWLDAQGQISGMWAHGATFDPPILGAAYKAMDCDVPWHYRAPRDTRTLFDLAGYEPPRAGVTHDALQDARDQAAWVTTALSRLRAPSLGPA